MKEKLIHNSISNFQAPEIEAMKYKTLTRHLKIFKMHKAS